MNKKLLLVAMTTAFMFGCDSAEEVKQSAEVVEIEVPAVKKHVIPEEDIANINNFYETASPDLFENARASAIKLESLSESASKALIPVTLDQLNRSDKGEWKAIFASNEQDYVIPLDSFNGWTVDGETLQVVLNEKGDYFLSTSRG